MAEPTNLHELRRRSTHEALRRVALAQFASQGFANVTVTQLATEAGVTERTFFRHFPSKEAVLFQDYDTHLEWLAEALAQRPASRRPAYRGGGRHGPDQSCARDRPWYRARPDMPQPICDSRSISRKSCRTRCLQAHA